jgi:methionine-rich copper-binding protein CopC
MSAAETCRGWQARLSIVLVAACVVVGCGGGGGGGETTVPPALAVPDFAPLAVGDTWVYLLEDGSLERVRATGTRVVDGQSAILVSQTALRTGKTETTAYRKSATALTEVPDGSNSLLTAIGDVDNLRLPLRVGDTFTPLDKTLRSGFDIDGDNRSDAITLRATVTVLATETVTVPAGTFSGSIKVRTELTQSAIASSTGQLVTFTVVAEEWYAPEIGVVRSRLESTSGGVATVETRQLQAYKVGTRSNDARAPQITSTTPLPGATTGRTVVLVLEFDEDIDASALDDGAVRVVNSAGHVVGSGRNFVSGKRLQSNLPAPLGAGNYTLRLDDTVQDLLGNRITAREWALTVDGTGPALVSATPSANSTQVGLASPIELQFSEAVNLQSLRANVVIAVAGSLGRIDYTATLSNPQTVRLQPNVGLAPNTDYELRIDGGLSDLFGNAAGQSSVLRWRTGGGLFRPPQEVNAFINETAIAAGDVNSDGRADMVSVGPELKTLLVRRQIAGGALAAADEVPLRASTSTVCPPDSIQIADLNGDGRADVVVAERGCGLGLLLQDASGRLVPGPFLVSSDSHVVRAADLNGDGLNDLVAVGNTGGTVTVWLQQAGGGWSAARALPLAYTAPVDLAIGDINGDGRPDIVVASGGGGPGKGLGLLLQVANGAFEPGGYLQVNPTWGAYGVAIGDLNGDGRADIASGFGMDDGLALFYQGADGRLQPPLRLDGFDSASYLAIADVNADGLPDLVVRQRGLTPLVVLLQQTGGTLQRAQQFDNELFSTNGPDRLAVADLNGDGKVDVLFSGPRVFYAVSSTATPSAEGRRPLRRGALGGVPVVMR